MPAARVDFASLRDGLVTAWLSVGRDWTVTQVHCDNKTDKGALVMVHKDGSLLYRFKAQPHKKSAWRVRGVRLGQQPDYWDDLEEKWQRSGIDMKGYSFIVSWPPR